MSANPTPPTPDDQDTPEEVELRPSVAPPPIPELLRRPVGITPRAVAGGIPGASEERPSRGPAGRAGSGTSGGAGRSGGADQDASLMQRLVKISTVGTSFAFAVGGIGILGWAVQRWLLPGFAPWPLVAGLGLGLVGGFIRFVRDATALMKD